MDRPGGRSLHGIVRFRRNAEGGVPYGCGGQGGRRSLRGRGENAGKMSLGLAFVGRGWYNAKGSKKDNGGIL